MNRHTRNLLWASALLLPVAAGLAVAMDNEDYDNCILQHQKTAKTNYAVQLVKEACTKLHKESAFLFSDELRYYQCILDNVPGVENDRALESIRQACRRQSEG